MKWVRDNSGRFRQRPYYLPNELEQVCEDAICKFLRTRRHVRDDVRELRSDVRADISDVRGDLARMDDRLRAVEISFGKVDQRLATLERLHLPTPPAD